MPEEGNHAWSVVNKYGGSGSYTYEWLYSEGGSFTSVGTSSTYSRFVEENDPDFTLKWVVTSMGRVLFSGTIAVQLCWNHENIPCDA